MIRFEVRGGAFHNWRVFATCSAITQAFEDVSVHREECPCGGVGVVAIGSTAELEAAGAYTDASGLLVYPHPEGGEPIPAVRRP